MEAVDAEAVLAEAATIALRTGTRVLEPAAVEKACEARGIDHDGWFAALADLRTNRLVPLQVAEPSAVVLLTITNDGLERHLRATRPDIDQVEQRLAAAVHAALGQGPQPLTEVVGEPPLLVECLLDGWVNRRLVASSTAPVGDSDPSDPRRATRNRRHLRRSRHRRNRRH